MANIDEWAQGRRAAGRRPGVGNFIDRELTDEQREVIRDSWRRGYGVTAILAYMHEVHGVRGLTKGALAHWIGTEGLTRD